MKYFKQQTDLERTYIELYGKRKEVNAENKTKNKKKRQLKHIGCLDQILWAIQRKHKINLLGR